MSDSINVTTGFDADLLMRLFTTDISAEECIYDLIDNSIDAARGEIQSKKYEKDEFGLPRSYSGYRLTLNISDTEISIEDNCSGISRSEFGKSTFVIGHRKSQEYSIGFYGIGLKRAMLKLGNTYKVESDNGKDKILFSTDKTNFSSQQKPTTAKVLSSGGDTYLNIAITDIDEEVRKIIQNKRWLDELKLNIGRRYGIFIDKGLTIKVGNTAIKSDIPRLRQRGPVAPIDDQINTNDVVKIHVKTGMHQKYRMSHEAGYSLAKNKKLTSQYGWYVVCNDRIMIVGDKTRNVGLTSEWHTEYNGFVGWIYFVAKNGEDLPWNTKKTAIVTEHAAYMSVREVLQEYTDDWKSRNKQARSNNKRTPSQPKGSKKGASISPKGTGSSGGSKKPASPKPKTKPAKPDKIERIEYHQEIYDALNSLGNNKLISLYYSICDIELEDHTPIIAVGVWSFLETLSAEIGRKSGNAFKDFWKQGWAQSNGLPNSENNKAYKGQLDAMTRLQDVGNITKHDPKAAAYNGEQLNNDFIVLKNIIEKSIEIAIANK